MAIDLTPAKFKCVNSMSCPGVFELESDDQTPGHLRCFGASGCPAVVAHAGDLVIIGKRADALAKQLGKGVGPDEYAIIIGQEYFANYIRQIIAAAKDVGSATPKLP